MPSRPNQRRRSPACGGQGLFNPPTQVGAPRGGDSDGLNDYPVPRIHMNRGDAGTMAINQHISHLILPVDEIYRETRDKRQEHRYAAVCLTGLEQPMLIILRELAKREASRMRGGQ